MVGRGQGVVLQELSGGSTPPARSSQCDLAGFRLYVIKILYT
ncbi:MAG: hypothetical protein UW83_C0044G0008, partial [Parcubacteria group bacterium GW2011_GWD1_44_9]